MLPQRPPWLQQRQVSVPGAPDGGPNMLQRVVSPRGLCNNSNQPQWIYSNITEVPAEHQENRPHRPMCLVATFVLLFIACIAFGFGVSSVLACMLQAWSSTEGHVSSHPQLSCVATEATQVTHVLRSTVRRIVRKVQRASAGVLFGEQRAKTQQLITPPRQDGPPALVPYPQDQGYADAHSAHTPSLLCIALITPWSDEMRLIEWQFANNKGIAACDGAAIYSNDTLQVAPGIQTHIVDADLKVDFGGPWHTSMNTPVFSKLWSQVVIDSQFRQHDWIVKLDPDTVFLPGRLRSLLRGSDYHAAANNGNGMFLNNCKMHGSLHGAIEVLSQKALSVFAASKSGCSEPPQEDIYLRTCLLSLGVQPKNEFDVLSDFGCDAQYNKSIDVENSTRRCALGKVAIHPFKDVELFEACMAIAESSSEWPPARLLSSI